MTRLPAEGHHVPRESDLISPDIPLPLNKKAKRMYLQRIVRARKINAGIRKSNEKGTQKKEGAGSHCGVSGWWLPAQ